MVRVLAGVLALVFTSVAFAQAPDEPKMLMSGGMPPSVGVVEGVRGGKLIVREMRLEQQTATRTKPVVEKVMVNGKEQERTRMVMETYVRPVAISTDQAYDLANIRAFDTNGAPIPTSRLAGLFPKPRMVLLGVAGVPVDPAFLRIARDGTPFLVVPAAPLVLPAPAPAPAAP